MREKERDKERERVIRENLWQKTESMTVVTGGGL